jgi:hypothetical protein
VRGRKDDFVIGVPREFALEVIRVVTGKAQPVGRVLAPLRAIFDYSLSKNLILVATTNSIGTLPLTPTIAKQAESLSVKGSAVLIRQACQRGFASAEVSDETWFLETGLKEPPPPPGCTPNLKEPAPKKY